MSGLHQAVARAIADDALAPKLAQAIYQYRHYGLYTNVPSGGKHYEHEAQCWLESVAPELAAAAVGVVLAEATRSIEARRIEPPQNATDSGHNWGIERALAALAALGEHA